MDNGLIFLKDAINRDEVESYAPFPKDWPINQDALFLLKVTECRHFRKEGIRKGGYIGIDASLPFAEGKPCAFVKTVKGKKKFKLSRKRLEGYECVGQLALVISFPLLEDGDCTVGGAVE